MAHGKIADRHDQIFDKDPLLLNKDSQIRYGENMLEDLLISRTISAVSSVFVDLQDDESRDRFTKGILRQAPVIDQDAKLRYKDSRTQRSSLDAADLALLKQATMVCRGEYTDTRVNLSIPIHSDAVEKLSSRLSSLNKRLRIASVCYRVQISKTEDLCALGEELCALPRLAVSGLPENDKPINLERTYAPCDIIAKEWQVAVKRHIDKALSQGSHFIVLPEFSLPPSISCIQKFEDEIVNCSMPDCISDHFMFAGSRHEGAENRGLVISKSGGVVSKPWWHYKVASAKGLGENILGAAGKYRPQYRVSFEITEGLFWNVPVEIAICYDTFDPTVFLGLVLQCIGATNVEALPRVVIVPSFNPSRDFVALLRDLSFLCRAIVIYVNGLHGDAKLYICGFAIADFMGAAAISKVRGQVQKQKANLLLSQQKIVKNIILDAKQVKESSRLREMISALTALDASLEKLEGAGAFEGIMTLESGNDDEIKNGRYDPRDTLYYNIDIGIIGALADFRSDYFGVDDFLPFPFQYDKLRSAVDKVDDFFSQKL